MVYAIRCFSPEYETEERNPGRGAKRMPAYRQQEGSPVAFTGSRAMKLNPESDQARMMQRQERRAGFTE